MCVCHVDRLLLIPTSDIKWNLQIFSVCVSALSYCGSETSQSTSYSMQRPMPEDLNCKLEI